MRFGGRGRQCKDGDLRKGGLRGSEGISLAARRRGVCADEIFFCDARGDFLVVGAMDKNSGYSSASVD